MLTFFFLPFFSSLIWSGAASAEAPRPPREATWETRFTLSYFDTTENFTSSGRQTLLAGGEYTNLLGDFRFTYDWQADWRFYGSLNVVRADSALASNSGINELMVGAQNWYEAGKFDIALEGEFVYPVWRVDEGSDSPLLGEGAMRVKGGSWAFLPLGRVKPFAYVGFEYRDEGRASVIPYNLGVKGRIQRIWIQGEVRGYERILDDEDSGNLVERLNNAAFLQRADSGSMRYYAINPSYSELAIEAGSRFGDWGVFAGFAYSVNGQNTAAGWTGYGGVTFSPKAMHKPNEKRDEVFDPRNESYDENVFRESSPVVPEPAEDQSVPEPVEPNPTDMPFNESPTAETPSDSPRSAAPPEITQPLPKAEVQLQLRRVKKKTPVKKRKTSKKLQNMMDDAESFLEKRK